MTESLSFVRKTSNGMILSIFVKPGARQNRLVGLESDLLHLQVK